MALLPKKLRFWLFDTLSVKTMRYLQSVPRHKADGVVAEVYDQIADDFFVNGSLEHPYGLPGVECTACGETWGKTRVVTVTCPETLRSVHELNERWPISAD